jgi:hypothetical protein
MDARNGTSSYCCGNILELVVARQVLRFLHAFDKLVLFHATLAFHTPIGQNLFQLFHPQFRNILLFHLVGFYGEFDGANFGVGFTNALAHLQRRHVQRKGLGHIAFDGIADSRNKKNVVRITWTLTPIVGNMT